MVFFRDMFPGDGHAHPRYILGAEFLQQHYGMHWNCVPAEKMRKKKKRGPAGEGSWKEAWGPSFFSGNNGGRFLVFGGAYKRGGQEGERRMGRTSKGCNGGAGVTRGKFSFHPGGRVQPMWNWTEGLAEVRDVQVSNEGFLRGDSV